MIAWRRYQQSLCNGCGQPRATAWHPNNDDSMYEVLEVTCHGCTAMARANDPNAEPVKHSGIEDTRDYDEHPLPPIRPEDFES